VPAARRRFLLVALAGLSLYVAAVWAVVLLRPAGGEGAFVALGLPLTSAFIFAHLLGLAAGGLLWHGRAVSGGTGIAVRLATLYFALACLYAFIGSLLMSALVNAFLG
jgi:hypothetical protein